MFMGQWVWCLSDNRAKQVVACKTETTICSLHTIEPLISLHSTFSVDFKGLQHPLCLGALRVQKKTSELQISKRAELKKQRLYLHHGLHAKHCNSSSSFQTSLNLPLFLCRVHLRSIAINEPFTFHKYVTWYARFNCPSCSAQLFMPLDSFLLNGGLIPDKVSAALQ